MKKLMIMATALVLAATVNAGQALWNLKTIGSGANACVYAAGGTSTKLYDSAGAVTFYLFDAATYDQQTILSGLRDEKKITSYTAAKTTSLTSGSKISESEFGYGTGGTKYNFFIAAVVGDQVLLSDDAFTDATEGSDFNAVDIKYSNIKSWSNTASKGTANFSDAGWYALVPEPTSGLMLLLGMGVLALRRRRA